MEQIVIIKPDKKTVPLQSKGSVTKITKAEQRMKLLGEDLVQISVESPYPQNYEIGDKIVVFGREYTLNVLPTAKKKGASSFAYDLNFEGVQYLLARAQYEVSLDTTGIEVDGDSLMGDLRRFMQVLIQNINRIFPGRFVLGTCPDTDAKNLTFNCENCLAVLQRLCTEFEQEFDIQQNSGIFTINIHKAGTIFPYTFEYGKGRGMYELNRQNVSTSNIVTRLKVFGADKNVGSKYRNNRLCLSGKSKSKSYIEDAEAIARYGVWENTKNFEDIYPKRTGKITAKGSLTFSFVDSSMFNLNETESDGVTTKYLIDGVAAKVHFNTGGLAGYEFDIHSYDHATKTFILKRFTDDRGNVFPSETSAAFQPKPGDEYVILDINLPQSYIDEAEKLLAEKGKEYLGQNCQPKVQYGLTIDQNFLRQFVGEGSVGNIFAVGDYIPVKDADLEIDKSIRIVGFNRDLLQEYKYTLTIAESVQKDIYSRIISELIDIDKILQINDLANPSKARRKWLSAQELLGMIFDPEGDYYSEKIKPGSIETLMLSVGAKSMQLMLQNTMIEANYNGNKNVVRVTGGVLTHYTIEDTIRNWNLSTMSNTLTGDANAFYIYAKCQKAGTGGTLIFSTTQFKVDSDPNYYHFWIGVVHSVVDNVRAISLTYGSTTINGKFIRTGQIESSDGSCVINLDGNHFKIGDSSSSLEWNKNGDKKLRLKGTLIQSPSGTESPLGVWRGTYNASTIYYPGDEVAYSVNNIVSSYRRIGTSSTQNATPTNTTYWQLIAQGSQGTSGNWVSYVFKQSETQPSKPTGTASLPSGWSDAPTATGKWWMSKATISGSTGLAGAWSTPVQVTAKDGVNGSYMEFKFRANTSPTTAPTLTATSRNPAGWNNYPASLSTGQFLWMTQAEIDADDKLVYSWSTPVRISGEKGETGAKGDKGDRGDIGLDGAAIVFRGEYSSTATYYGTAARLDIVKYNNMYYKAKRTAGAFNGIVPTNTGTWEEFGAQFDSIATNLLLAEGASIGDWSIQGGKIVSTLGTGDKITLDATGAKIKVESSRSGGDYSTNKYLGSIINIDAYNGYIEARSKSSSSRVSYMSPSGIFSNNAETNAVSAVLGVTHKAAIVGLGFGTVNKSDWQNENFLAGVYGRASNDGSAPAYGGFFQNLMAAGLFLKTRAVEETSSSVYLTENDSLVVGYSRNQQLVYLPNDAVIGRTIFVKQWWHGYMRFYPRAGQTIWDDASENAYYDFGQGQGGMFTFVVGYVAGVKKEAWLVSRWKY